MSWPNGIGLVKINIDHQWLQYDNEDYKYDNDDHEDIIEDNNHNHYEDNRCQRLTHRPMQGWNEDP